jgi:UDP-N-acetylglucosamine 1-carboxyvinyltransferase
MASEQFIISGGTQLNGEITVSGSKNAALAIIPAALLAKTPSILENVPHIEDVERLLDLLRSMGVEARWEEPHTLFIHAREVDSLALDQSLVSRLRASISLLGPLLARTGIARIAHPGGDLIGARPVDTHLAALEALGALTNSSGSYYELQARALKGARIALREFSVTATQNALTAAVLAKGGTHIEIAAAEPQVTDLARFLTAMGARIKGIGTHDLEIEGVRSLSGARYRIMPDHIEAATFAIAIAATRGAGVIKGADPSVLTLPLVKLREAGIPIKIKNQKSKIKNGSDLIVEPALKMTAIPHPGIQTLPYPGLPSDVQAPFCVLATQLSGATVIQETIYEGRLRHIEELAKMGANAMIMDPHRALVIGPTALYGREIQSLDLRAGATLVIAALVAEGRSVIKDVYTIDRGYERLEEKLEGLGAEIKRVRSA